MKLNKRLTVDGAEVPIVADMTLLELNKPGRAIFAVQADKPLKGEVRLSFGWGDKLQLWFTGVVLDSQAMDRKQQRFTVQELPAVLQFRAPVSLRRTSPRAVLEAMARINHLQVSAEAAWLDRDLPIFVNPGTGEHLLHGLRRALGLEECIIQSQPDGSVYFGTWAGSPAARAQLQLPPELLTDITALGGTAPLAAFLRPGVRLQVGPGAPVTITRIEASSETMRLTWRSSQWQMI
ncbi:MAG: hypothetical protein RL095_3695 [Verrucomicrobiota bacterium]|jgi:hypothetical protein